MRDDQGPEPPPATAVGAAAGVSDAAHVRVAVEEVGEPWRAMGVALGTRFGRVAVDGWAEGLTLGAGTAVKYVRGGGGDAIA